MPEFESSEKAPTSTPGPRPLRWCVALCTYNGERYIRTQVDSILAQAPPCSELVVVDDASHDASVAAVRDATAGVSTPIVLDVNPANTGSLVSFQRALGRTTQPIVFLSDQDDRWHADKVARMLAAFDARPDLLFLHTDAHVVDQALQPLGYGLFESLRVAPRERRLLHEGRAFEVYLRRNLATGATAAFRRELLDDALPIPAGWVHDEWLAIIASAIGRVDFLDEPLIDYRQHASNQIGARKPSLSSLWASAVNRKQDWYHWQVYRLESLIERLVAIGDRVDPDRVVQARNKLAHFRVRASLPRSRLFRMVPVLREALNGRYFRFSSGSRAIAIDLSHG